MFDWLKRAAQGVGNFIYNSTPAGGALRTVNRAVNRRDPRLQQQQQIQQRQVPQAPPPPRINLPKINLNQANSILNKLSNPFTIPVGNVVDRSTKGFNYLTQPQVRGVKDFVKPKPTALKPLGFEATARDINTGQIVPKPPVYGMKAGIEPRASLVGKMASPPSNKSPVDGFLSGLNMAFRQATGQKLAPDQEALLRRSPQANAYFKFMPRPDETANAFISMNPIWSTARDVKNQGLKAFEFQNVLRRNNPLQGFADINSRIQRDTVKDPFIQANSQQGFNKKVLELNTRASDNSKQFISDVLNKVVVQGGANLPGVKQVRQTTPGKFVGENIADPMLKFYIDTLARVGGTGTGQKDAYAGGIQGWGQGLTDITNVGSLAYTGAKAGQLAAAPLNQALKLAPGVFGRQALANSGANVLNQFAEGKKYNQIDPIQVAGAGILGGALGTGIPLGGKVLGKGISKVLGRGVAKVDLNAPITVKTYVEKGKLLEQGYKNVKIKFNGATHKIQNDGVVTELAPKGIKGVKIDKSTQEAVDAGALSPKLAQQGYKVTPELEIIAPNGKKLSIGEIQQLEQSSALTKAEQKIAQGQETYAQAEDLTQQLGKQPARVADDFNQPRSPNGRYGNKEFNPELEQLKAYQTEQLQVLQRANQNSPEYRGAMDNYNAAQKRIDILERPKTYADNAPKSKDPLESLKAEARKYKSADEFVKAQPKLYRGVEKTSELGGHGGRGTYLTSDKNMAGAFTGKNGKVLDLYVDRSRLKVKKSKAPINTDSVQGKPFYDFSDDLVERPQDFQQTIANLKRNGIEAVESSDGRQLLVFDKSKIKTKAQLTDLYNQAHKGKPIYETVPKGTFSEKGLSGDKKIGNKFERQLGKQYESSGSVEYTGLDKGMKDGGIDLTVKNNDGSISLIQAKVRGQKTSLHEKPVQAFWNAFQQYTKDNPGVRVGAILHTTSRVDPDAIKFANSHGIKIIQQNIDGTGQKVITSGKPVKLKPYQVAISGQELSRIQNSIPVSNRSQFLKDIQNPDSDISKAFGSVERSRWLSMASDYYKASNPQGTYELGALKGLSSKLSRASTQEEVKKIIQDDIASNSRLGGFNPIDQKVLAQLEDSSFVSKIIKSNNPSEIRKLIGGDLYQPIKGTTNLRVETESPILLGGDKERGFISNVRSSSNTEDTTRTILSQASGYTPKSNKVLEVQANKRVIADPSEARAFALSNTNDEAVATAGQLIKHYQNTGDYGAAAQVADDVAKRLTEAGRTVQAASLYGRLSPVGVVQYAAAKAKSGGKELSAESSEVLTNLAKKIEKMSDGEDRQIAIKEMMDIIGKAKGSAISDKIITLWKSGLLTSPVTTAGNLTSNTFKQIVKKASDDPIAAVTDMMFSLVTGKRTKTFTGRGLIGGAGEGGVRGIKYFKTGYDIRNPIDKLDSKQVYFSDSWAGKVAQKYSDSVFRLMGAQDQPYFYAALRNTLYDQALAAAKNQGVKGQARDQFIKKFVNNTPSDIMDVATEEARQAVFQNKTMLSSIASKINQSDNTAVRALGQFLMPFSKVPSAVATEIFDRTPLGAAKEIVKQVAKRKFDQRAMSNAIAKSTTGTVGIMGLGYALDRGDSINLAFPQSETERNLWELEGRQPFSVKIGDKWISLNYVQPFGSLIAMGAQYHRSLKDGGSVQDALASSAAMGAKAVTEQSFLRGVGGALGALQDPARQAERYVEQTAGSVIPNFIRTTARATDPVQRQINNAGEAVIAGVPGLRQTLLPKQNVFGQEIARADSPLGTMINPFRPTTAKSDPTIEELRRLYDTKNGVLPSELDKSAFGKDKQITPAQINELQASVGQPVLERWQKIMADYRYKRLSDEDKAKVLKDARDAISRGEKYAFAQDNGLGDTKLDKDSIRYLEGNEKDYLARDLPKRKAAQASSKPKRVAKAKKGRKAKVGRIAKSSAPKLRSIKLSAGKVPKISRTAKVKFRRYA